MGSRQLLRTLKEVLRMLYCFFHNRDTLDMNVFLKRERTMMTFEAAFYAWLHGLRSCEITIPKYLSMLVSSNCCGTLVV